MVLTPSPEDKGAASLELLQALLVAAPEAQHDSTAGGCTVKEAREGATQVLANIPWREGDEWESVLTMFPHLAVVSKVRLQQAALQT